MNEDILTFLAEKLALLIKEGCQLNELSSYLDNGAPAYIHTYMDHARTSVRSAFAVVSEEGPQLSTHVIDECRMIC